MLLIFFEDTLKDIFKKKEKIFAYIRCQETSPFPKIKVKCDDIEITEITSL